MAFGNHVDKLLVKEGEVVVARFVRALLEGVLKLEVGPGRRGHYDWRATVLVEGQQAAGRVMNVVR